MPGSRSGIQHLPGTIKTAVFPALGIKLLIKAPKQQAAPFAHRFDFVIVKFKNLERNAGFVRQVNGMKRL